MQKHLHVTDVNEAGAFAVNTFDRATRSIQKPMSELPHVVHMQHGSPSVGVVVGKVTSRTGRTAIEVIEPARGPRGPYVRNVTVDADSIFPQSAPLPEATRFMGALAQYRYNPNDYYWDQANVALAAWMSAVEASPPMRPGGGAPAHLPQAP